MSTALTSPVTGSAQTGFTSPTYTLVSDVPPDSNGRQYAVTALGGTQVGATANTPSSPFTVTFVRPKAFKLPAARNSNTGLASAFPRNNWKVIVRKGAYIDVTQSNPPQVMTMTADISLPAGAESNSPAEIRAMLSLFIGSLSSISASLGDSLVTGVL